MIISEGIKQINKLFISIIAIFTLAVSSYAAEASLSGIDVNKIGNDYNIVLKLDGKARVTKSAETANKLTVLLNSTLPAEAMDIVYDNASSLTNVIVQKKNKHNTMIIFEGDKVKNSDIYTKELSTGVIKPLGNNNIFTGLLFITDRKLLAASLSAVLLFFFLMLISRPKAKRTSVHNSNNTAIHRKQQKINTLRNKNMVRSGYVPSINAGVNGSFTSARRYMTQPDELVVNNSYEEEQIRKAG